MSNSNAGGSSLGGGPYNGFSPKQTINANKNRNTVQTKKVKFAKGFFPQKIALFFI
jgi:hypothetical protein